MLQAGHVRVASPVHATAQVDEPPRFLDQSGEQVRRHDVHPHDLRPADDARVVDHRVDGSEAVHLLGHLARLPGIGQVADDPGRAAVEQVPQGGQPLGAARVDDHVVPVAEQRRGGRPAQPVSGSGDDDACHRLPHWCRVAGWRPQPQVVPAPAV